MVIADEAGAFAEACASLLQDAGARTALAKKALACAGAHFSASACFRTLAAFVRDTETSPRMARTATGG